MAALLSRDIATRDYAEAVQNLRSLLLAVEELRIEGELRQTGVPDISAPLAYLARSQRYDGCKNLLSAFETFMEAQVNVQLATQRHEYEKVVEGSGSPEYLRPEE